MYESNAEIQESKEKLEIEKINYQLNINEKNTSIIIIVVAYIGRCRMYYVFNSNDTHILLTQNNLR